MTNFSASISGAWDHLDAAEGSDSPGLNMSGNGEWVLPSPTGQMVEDLRSGAGNLHERLSEMGESLQRLQAAATKKKSVQLLQQENQELKEALEVASEVEKSLERSLISIAPLTTAASPVKGGEAA
mmetsp:Transcript_3322/g.9002  ORF Transcript_3322/g.9002 Transcript_3322/m.9002 type:complete len:126 (-) Transcript_3322:114-491(-)